MTFKYKYLFLIVAHLFLFNGCLQDEIIRPIEKEDCEIIFEFSVPDAGSFPTRALTETEESMIDDVYVFIFNVSGNNETLEYYARATITGTNVGGTVTTGRVALYKSQGTDKHRLVFVANSATEIEAAITAGQITTEMSYSVFAPVLTTHINSILLSEPTSSFKIPMWGETGEITVSAALDLTQGNAINMQRSLAKIDIGVNIQPDGSVIGLPDFTITGITVYNVNSTARVIPDRTNLGNDGYAQLPTLATSTKADVIRNYSPGDKGAINSIYVPEIENTEGTSDADRPYIIIKGIYTGNDTDNTAETYYRINFRQLQSSMEWISVLRNYSYTFNIKEVHREGYETLQEAIDKLPLGLSYDFYPKEDIWTDYTAYAYNDVGYLALTLTKVEFDFNATTTSNLVYGGIKTEYKGRTGVDVDAYFCDINGNEINQTEFSTVISANQIRFYIDRPDNQTEEDYTIYCKIFLKEYPEINYILPVTHNPIKIIAVVPYYNNDEQSYLSATPATNNIRFRGIAPSGTTNFRVKRLYDNEIVTGTVGTISTNGTTAISPLPVHDSYQYEECIIEWQHPFTGTWLEVGKYYQPGVHYWLEETSGCYVAATDAYSTGTSYTGNWATLLGVSSTYNSSLFNENGSFWYTTTQETGCAAYYEGSETHAVTGKGKWRAPTVAEAAEIRLFLQGTNGRNYGINRNSYSSSSYYVTSQDYATNMFYSYRLLVAGTSNSLKTSTTHRVRCVRDPAP